MKKYKLIFSSFCLIIPAYIVWAQDASNSKQSPKRVENPDFVIESKGSKLELLPNNRANLTSKNGQMNRSTESADEVFTTKKLGILFNHNSGAENVTTGEITFKLKSGVSEDSLQALMLPNVVLVMKPDIYLIKTATPGQMVKIARQLNASALVEWSEPFIVPSNIN
jgi:hypothetical protein